MTMTDMASAATGHDGAVASGKGARAGQPKRRTFTAAYKARILREYDQLESGRERGALLRREGLYSSHIDGWRKARDAGTVNGLAEKPAGRPDAAPGRWKTSGCARRTRNSPRS
jgi:transposase-like protein